MGLETTMFYSNPVILGYGHVRCTVLVKKELDICSQVWIIAFCYSKKSQVDRSPAQPQPPTGLG